MESSPVFVACVLILSALGVRSDHHCPALFDVYDRDHRDGLSFDEFKGIFIPTFDTEFPADGQVSRDEMINGWRTGHCDIQDRTAGLLIFMESDVDRDMVVTGTDLNNIFQEFDHDRNQHLSASEFRSGWSNRYGRHSLHSVAHH
ncbi:uncharacterized protein [Magallana gigas]|uniref:EF-hand domain-containing protein n=1 Tax=Magallana gigas TaxID=29159 RepID=A0A8W8KGI3_MAGGI|nr:uncharacterized protein LOC105335615 [Crassostrea gigas]